MNEACELSLSFKCPKTFEELSGKGTSRFCQQCSKNVTDLSNMQKVEAVTFLCNAKANTCVHYKTDVHGKVLFKSSFIEKFTKRLRRFAFSLIALFVPGSFALAGESDSCKEPPESNLPATCSDEEDWEFIGELSPFTIDINPAHKRSVRALHFHTKKNYQNNRSYKQSPFH